MYKRQIYADPIYPKNQYLDAPPSSGWLARERATRQRNIELLESRGVFTPIAEGHEVPPLAVEQGALNARESDSVTA